MNHIDESLLNEYLDEALPEDQSRAISAHLANCQTCMHALNELKLVFSALDEVADIPLTTDLTPEVMAKLGQRHTSMSTRLRLAVVVQAVATLTMVIWLWPLIRLWLDRMGQQFVEMSAWFQSLQSLNLEQASTQVYAWFDWLREAGPKIDVTTGQWIALLTIALIAWLAGNGFLMTPSLNGGTDG